MGGFAIHRSIPLTQGKVAWVDQADYADIVQFKWHAEKPGRRDVFYASRGVGHGRGNRRIEKMHRRILGLSPGDGLQVDHINGDGIDNRRRNLRVCTHAENHANLPPYGGVSRFKGVSWYARHERWVASIHPRGDCIHLGYFDNEESAAHAYDRAAAIHFGGFARLNFPKEAAL